jgi:predicted nucleic acid-binding protein
LIYIDTDVLIHAYIIQDERKHRQANELVEAAVSNAGVVISTLTIQEALFVLERNRVASERVLVIYDALMQMQPIAYDVDNLQRAVNIAKKVGFRNINDCIHTAIAESHCSELITYNRRDFKRIRDFATVDIKIL